MALANDNLVETERDRAMARNAIYRDALRLLAEGGCERDTKNKRYCIEHLMRDADYYDFSWCNACVATAALEDAAKIG